MKQQALRHDSRGAVFVEKLIVYLPMLMAFFLAWDLAELGAAKLIVQRASAAAGRAAVVVLPDDPLYYDGEAVHSYSGKRRDDIELAAGMILSANPKLNSDFVVDVTDPPGELGGSIEVSVHASYECGGASLLCMGLDSLELSASTTHTYQGAKYAYGAGGGLGGSGAALVSTDSGYRSGYRTTNNNGKRPADDSDSTGGGDSKKPKPCHDPLPSLCADASRHRDLYRVIREDEDPSKGLFPKDPNANKTVQQHVGNGSGKDFVSQFISTTTSLLVAQTWACKTKKPLRIVRINPSGVSGSLTDLSCGDHPALPGATAANFAISSQEVLVEGTIPASAVTVHSTGPFSSKECNAIKKRLAEEKKQQAEERKRWREENKRRAKECGCE